MTEPPDVLDRLQHELADRYRVDRELGGGGMSRVFVAVDQGLGRRVVIKVLRPSLAAALSVERFRREVEVAAALQHPNVVPVLAAGVIGGEGASHDAVPYYVMPFVDGESLRERLVRGPLSVRETVNVARDVARGLSFAHGRGIVHRDVKPGNVLLSAGAAVVTDFGVAKALSASRDGRSGVSGGATGGASVHSAGTLTQIGTSLGTPAYMAPEQAAADPNVDFRADLYALGVVMYEMLVGSPPFHGRTPQALLTAQLSEPPPPIAVRRYDVPAKLAELVMRCLEKDPTRRPRSAADVLRSLEDPDILSGAFATPAVVRRRRWRIAAFAAPAVLVAAAVWAFGVARSPTPPPSSAAGAGLSPPNALESTDASAPPARAVLARSVAVLPLDAVGNDARAAAVAEGLGAELTTALAGVPGMRVASHSGAAALRARRALPEEIARSLGVTLLVEGTVQREGERVRVTLRVVDAALESTVWSRTIDGRADAVLALQDVASSALVGAFSARAPNVPR